MEALKSCRNIWFEYITSTRQHWKGAHMSDIMVLGVDDVVHTADTKRYMVNDRDMLLGYCATCPLCMLTHFDGMMNCQRCVMRLHPKYDKDVAVSCSDLVGAIRKSPNIEAAANEALDIVEAELRKL